jgi:hypothetical protein
MIPLTAAFLHREKVRFPVAVVLARGDTRLQLPQGIKQHSIITIRRDDLVGEVQLALRKWCDEILDLLAHEQRHGPWRLDLVGK